MRKQHLCCQSKETLLPVGKGYIPISRWIFTPFQYCFVCLKDRSQKFIVMEKMIFLPWTYMASDNSEQHNVYVVVQNYFGLKIFKPVWFLFSFVSDYGNEYYTKENKNQTGLKILKPKINLNHNIYNNNYQLSYFI